MAVSYIALVLMNAIDWLYTDTALSFGGDEANPLMLWIIQNYGIQGILKFKIAMLILMSPVVVYLPTRRRLRRFFYFACFVYTGLTIYHVTWYYMGEIWYAWGT